jgi:hypothetical protein
LGDRGGFDGSFTDMLVFDALIYNEDRHFGCFGLAKGISPEDDRLPR